MIMRIVFIDMQDINFLLRPYFQIRTRSKIHTFKHKFLLDYAFEQDIPVCNYYSGDSKNAGSSQKDKIKEAIKCLMHGFPNKKKEAEYVFKVNQLSDKVKFLYNASEINNDDIVIGYFHAVYQRELLKTLPGKKVMMLNHFIRVKDRVDLSYLDAVINEIDFSGNPFVEKYFDFGKTRSIICPFTFEDRFRIRVPFDQRKDKMVGMGTLSTVKGDPQYSAYVDYYHTEWVQPMRKMLFDHACEYPDIVDSYISYIYEDLKEIKDKDHPLIKLYKKAYNRHVGWQQKKYTSFDMVDKYNEYKMFTCPEEMVGMPGIGFVEGMACGCAMIGLDSGIYESLGLVPNVHYIPYDGTMEQLVKRVQYYQLHKDECARIAGNGTEFVRSHFNQKTVAEKFFEDLSLL